jgi:fatty acid amide hydrolase
MARHVEDLELAMSVLAAPGQDTFDPGVPPVPWADPKRVDVSRLRIASYSDDGFFPAAPGVRRAVDVAADALRAEGATVETWKPPRVGDAMDLFYGLFGADGGHWLKRSLGSNPTTPPIKAILQAIEIPAAFRPVVAAVLDRVGQRRTALLARTFRRVSTAQYVRLVEESNRYQREFLTALDSGRFDAVICPPHALPALTHGASFYAGPAASYAMLYNVLGFPAGVVAVTRVRAGEESDRPLSKDIVEKTARTVEQGSAGLPLGVQVAARRWREDIVLAVMAAAERRLERNADYPSGALAGASGVAPSGS